MLKSIKKWWKDFIAIPPITIGSLIKLRNVHGGPIMTVKSISDVNMVQVIYFDTNNHLQKTEFPIKEVRHASYFEINPNTCHCQNNKTHNQVAPLKD